MKHWSELDREEMIKEWLSMNDANFPTFAVFMTKHTQDAPQEKQLTAEAPYIRKCKKCNGWQHEDYFVTPTVCRNCYSYQPTSETYDQGRFIIVQDGDDEAFKNGNYYTAHLYFNSVQEWEIKEEYNTYLRLS